MILLNLSNLPWVPGRKKRNQAIFTQMLQSQTLFSRGIFIDPPVIASAPISKYIQAPRLRTVSTDAFSTVFEAAYSLPFWHLPALTRQWADKIAAAIKAALNGEPYLLWINSAGKLQTALAERLAPAARLRVFDASDDFTSWEGPEYLSQLRRVTELCDLVTCVNAHVATTITHANTLVFRNGTDFAALQAHSPDWKLAPWFPKPAGAHYIGFTGGINETRADEPLLHSLFQRFCDVRFFFIGYTDNPSFVNRLTRHPNVVFLPEVPYQQLPNLLRSFDVAIVPHRDNPVTRGNDLLKVLDYFACGLPVVATPCSNVAEHGNALYLARTPDEFGNCIENLLSGNYQHDPQPGYGIAQSRDWAAIVPPLAEHLKAHLAPTHVSALL